MVSSSNPKSSKSSKSPISKSSKISKTSKSSQTPSTPTPESYLSPSTFVRIIDTNSQFVPALFSTPHSILVHVLQGHPLFYALNCFKEVPEVYAQQLWHTMTYDAAARPPRFCATIADQPVELTQQFFREQLHLPLPDSVQGKTRYDPFSSKQDLCADIVRMGYGAPLSVISEFKRAHLPRFYYTLFSLLNKSLTSKGSIDRAATPVFYILQGLVFNKHYDFSNSIWSEFMKVVTEKGSTKAKSFLPFPRFLTVFVKAFMKQFPLIPRFKNAPRVEVEPILSFKDSMASVTAVPMVLSRSVLAYADQEALSVREYMQIHYPPRIPPQPKGSSRGVLLKRREGPSNVDKSRVEGIRRSRRKGPDPALSDDDECTESDNNDKESEKDSDDSAHDGASTSESESEDSESDSGVSKSDGDDDAKNADDVSDNDDDNDDDDSNSDGSGRAEPRRKLKNHRSVHEFSSQEPFVSDRPEDGSDHLVPDPVVSVIKPNNESIYVRRSSRLQPVQDQEIEEINLVDSEKGEDEARSGYNGGQRLLVSIQQNDGSRIDDSNNGPSSNQKSLDEKIDDLIKAIEGFKTNGVHANVSCENTSVNLIYKSLYLESQKKIEALTLENLELARNLEIALGKLEVYENINKSTYTVTISSLEKAIEALVRPMSHVGQSSFPGGDANPGGDGGAVANKPTTKKRKNDQTSK